MLDRPRNLFAFARCALIEKLEELADASQHAARTGPSANVRPGADPGHCLFWSRAGVESGEYVHEFRDYIEKTGARVRGGAAIAVHLLIGVSPDWLIEMGSLYDELNPRVQKLFHAVKDFAEKHIGGVLALRMDLDERGGGVVDVIASPTHMRKSRLRKDGTRGDNILEISVRTALESFPKKHGEGKSYKALQSLWARYARENLDSRMIRGIPYSVTGRRHRSPNEERVFEQQKTDDRETREGQLATFLTGAAHNIAMLDRLEGREANLEKQKANLTERDTRQKAREKTIQNRDRRSEQRARKALADTRRAAKIAPEFKLRAHQSLAVAEFAVAWLDRADRERAALHDAALADLAKERHEAVALRDAYDGRLRSLDERERILREKEVVLERSEDLLRSQEATLHGKLGDAAEAARLAEAATQRALAREAVAESSRAKFDQEAGAARATALRNREATERATAAEHHSLLAEGDALKKEGKATREREAAAALGEKAAAELAHAQGLQADLSRRQRHLERLEEEANEHIEKKRRLEAALDLGLTKIEQGSPDPSQFRADPALRPAANILERIVSSVTRKVRERTAAVEEKKKDLAAREVDLRTREKNAEVSGAVRARRDEESRYWQTIQPKLVEIASQCRSADFAAVPPAIAKLMTGVTEDYRRLKYGPEPTAEPWHSPARPASRKNVRSTSRGKG